MSTLLRGVISALTLTLGVGVALLSPYAADAATGDMSSLSLSVATTLSPERGGEVSRQSLSCTWYTVQPGDWLSRIASRYGLSWQTLASTNHLSNPNLIYPHEALCIPLGTAASPPPSAPASPPVPTQTTPSTFIAGDFCHGGTMWVTHISSWAIPPGCYAGIYYPNPRNYVYRASFGWCNWWPEVLHPNDPQILWHARHSSPIIGAVAVFAPGDQGASDIGHYAEVVGIGPNGWLLISEMNDSWRGAGFGRVNYRYVRLDGGLSFIWS